MANGLWSNVVVDCQPGAGGALASVANALGALDRVGPYLALTATDFCAGPSQFTVGFVPENKLPTPPIANAGQDQVAKPGYPVTFDGSGSVAAGPILAYVWTGQLHYLDQVVLTGETVEYTFASGYLYQVTLTVIDIYGQTSTDTMSVNVLPVMGVVTKGVTHSWTVGYSAPVPSTMSFVVENHGLKSLTLAFSFAGKKSPSNTLVIKISFVKSGAYPTGDVVTVPVPLPANSLTWVTAEDLDGIKGTYAIIYEDWSIYH